MKLNRVYNYYNYTIRLYSEVNEVVTIKIHKMIIVLRINIHLFLLIFLLCSSLQIVRKLMLDYSGLDNLVELVSNCDNDGVQQTAISSLVFLMQSIKCQSSLCVG